MTPPSTSRVSVALTSLLARLLVDDAQSLGRTGWGVVVLSGSSGRVNVERARLFAGLGAVCIALRWFGGEGQPLGICEVSLEVMRTTDRLIEEGCETLAYVGISKASA